MGQATNEQVNLMLRLFEDRREAKLREAREWYSERFHVENAEQAARLCPQGSLQNTYMRMVLGYWEMVASIANRGLIDEELYFETSGEQWGVWEQAKPAVGGWRKMFSNPTFLANLEESCARFEAWREKRAPGSNEAIRKMMSQNRETALSARA